MNNLLTVIMLFFLSFILVGIMYKKKFFGEKISERSSHLEYKKNTATMGGIVFLLINIGLLFFNHNWQIYGIISIGLLCGLLGLLDDYCKYKYSSGLSEKIYIIAVIIIGTIPVLFNFFTNNTTLILPFMKYIFSSLGTINFGLLYIPMAIYIFLGSCHSIGITDGINGGLACSTIVNCIFLYVATGEIYFIYIIGILLGFLCFNYNGKIFMGNVGSMFIGGILSTTIILYKWEIPMVMLGFLYVIEALSVIIQRYYIRNFKKKLFLFSPIHHHFELQNYSNLSIVLMMIGVSIIGGLMFLLMIYYG